MMNRLRGMLRKEWWQHRRALFFLSGYAGLVYLIISALHSDNKLSPIQTNITFFYAVCLVGSWYLAHRLVVIEYESHTQLYLETLPLRRHETLWIKFGFGFTWLLCAMGACSALTLWSASATEPISTKYILIVATRQLVSLWFLWGFFFMAAMAGRYKWSLYVGFFVLFVFLDQTGSQKWSPLALMDRDLISDRLVFPIRYLLQTSISAGAFTAIAFFLGSFREGALAEQLSRKMSARERAAFVLVVLVLLMALGLQPKKQKKPYKLVSARLLIHPKIPLQIAYHRDSRKADAQTLQAQLVKTLLPLQDVMGWKKLPTLRVIYSSALDAKTYERAPIAKSDGLLLRANFSRQKEWQAPAFVSFVIRELLSYQSEGRAHFEPQRWLHDGFSTWWSYTHLQRPKKERKQLLLRALYATQSPLMLTKALRHWDLFHERQGEGLALALAYTGALVLAQTKGEKTLQKLAKQMFAKEPPKGIGGLVWSWSHSPKSRFRKTTGLAWGPFVKLWQTWLNKQRKQPVLAKMLNALPQASVRWSLKEEGVGARGLQYEVTFQHRPLSKGAIVSLLHHKLPYYDKYIERKAMMRKDHIWPGGLTHTYKLAGRYGKGERVLLMLEVESPLLGCPIRLNTRRLSLQ